MANRMQIVNGALARIGEERVQALPVTEEERQNADDLATDVADIYFTERDALLDATPWSWLTERYALPRDPTYQGEGKAYPYRYVLRNPRVGSIRAIYDAEAAEIPRVEGWTRQGRHVLATFPAAWTDDQRQIAEEVFPNLFVLALTRRLAAELALQITEDVPTARYWDAKAGIALANAQGVDAQSKPPEAITDFPFVQARVSGTYGYGSFDPRQIAGLSEASTRGE